MHSQQNIYVIVRVRLSMFSNATFSAQIFIKFGSGRGSFNLKHVGSFVFWLKSDENIFFFFFFNRHCNPCGFWPAQPFSAGRFLQSAVASGTSNPQLGGPVIGTFQLPPPIAPHV